MSNQRLGWMAGVLHLLDQLDAQAYCTDAFYCYRRLYVRFLPRPALASHYTPLGFATLRRSVRPVTGSSIS